jgi:hypothetical protein
MFPEDGAGEWLRATEALENPSKPRENTRVIAGTD